MSDSRWRLVADFDSDIDIYFCDPHSPWQRGTTENTAYRQIPLENPRVSQYRVGMAVGGFALILTVSIQAASTAMNPGPCVLTNSPSYKICTYAARLDGVTRGHHNTDVEWRSPGAKVFARNRTFTVQEVR